MKRNNIYLIIGAMLLPTAVAASAQTNPAQPQAARPAPPPPLAAWVPKKTPYTPWRAPNRPRWQLADAKAMHRGKASWTQPIVRNKDLVADWHQLAPGQKTPSLAYSDNRTAIIVWEGEVRVSLDGQPSFTARKGFEIDIPFRIPFTIETLGSQPALYFQINAASDMPLYPLDTTTAAPKAAGWVYDRRIVTGGPGPIGERGKPFLDYYGDVVEGGARASAFIADQHLFVNNIRGRATPTPPASNLGHFHVGYDEFWFVMEGNVTLQVEGQRVFTAAAGDVISAPQGHWHRASFGGPEGQMGTRVAVNPYPSGGHAYTMESQGRQ
ncbi:cupin domain-containing protein [Sphingomonas qomolangmaensis]|uniref:Cupin domain-containing protein n=1 Tax=Sphingomonas qomolangmaensis TaxID=2918765 RepID=A0ABY5L827_9SPHN|nr:cupin domain-containing protein [Sphingomonas qomolangmaensis]UUL83125.1 cupin domain-containing protein [Sphingomonas qomolangmaensis]